MLKLSIITITLNSAATLERTILSIIQQGVENIEYCIVDGGSTDDTLDLIKKYEHYIHYWVSEKDEGISDAFNKGLKACSGDVVGIINSDDFYCSGSLRKVIGCFDSPGIEFVYGNMRLVDKEGGFLRVVRPSQKVGFPYGGMPFGHPTLFVKRSVYERFQGYNLNYKIAMDFEFYTRIRFLKSRYLDREIVTYSRGGVSDQFFCQGHREVLAASLASNEASFVTAVVSYIYRMSRTIFRKIGEVVAGRWKYGVYKRWAP